MGGLGRRGGLGQGLLLFAVEGVDALDQAEYHKSHNEEVQDGLDKIAICNHRGAHGELRSAKEFSRTKMPMMGMMMSAVRESAMPEGAADDDADRHIITLRGR
jgi:hypothetical protein